jgi:cytochrome b
MHQFAGYTALTALALRLAAAWLAPVGSPLRMPRPSWLAARRWCIALLRGDRDARRMRSPLYAWLAVVMLAPAIGIAATGAGADFIHAAEDWHQALAEAAPALFFGHLALAFWLHWLRPRSPAPATAPTVQSVTAP